MGLFEQLQVILGRLRIRTASVQNIREILQRGLDIVSTGETGYRRHHLPQCKKVELRASITDVGKSFVFGCVLHQLKGRQFCQ